MPELPEVETIKQGITPFLVDTIIEKIIVRQPNLRLPVTTNLNTLCAGKRIVHIERRGKYLIIYLTSGALLIHLGMSGHLRPISVGESIKKHDHIDLCLTNKKCLRYHDPRRFGLWLYVEKDPSQHSLLSHLGPEPLSPEFDGEYLYKKTRTRSQTIKALIMNHEVVVGVGNIYATESLFLAGIHPQISAKNLSRQQLQHLSKSIKETLKKAIAVGGTTLKDFYAFDGKPGYFSHELQVYGRKGLPCFNCKSLIQAIFIGGRNSFFCPQCQPA